MCRIGGLILPQRVPVMALRVARMPSAPQRMHPKRDITLAVRNSSRSKV